MSYLLTVIVSLSLSLTSASLCNLTDLLMARGDGGRYFSAQRNNSCYVFALKDVPVKKAQKFCRTIGGRLADVESQTDNYLQKLIANDKTDHQGINTEYWIGLFWNGYLKAFYWDTGAAVRDIYPPDTWNPIWRRPCVAMTSTNMARYYCGEDVQKPFICRLDLGCHKQEVTNSSVCTPLCRDYIQGHLSIPETTPWPTSPWNESTDSPEAATQTTDGGNGTGYEEQNKVVAECQPCQAEEKMVWMILAGVGAFTAVLLVAILVMCALIVKYRRLLNDKDTSHRISMVDILHADSPSTSRGKRPSNQSGSHPGSTSELLYNNPNNTYSTPEGDGGQAAEVSEVFYQENGYSEASGRSPSGNEVRFEPQHDSAGNNYTQLNRAVDHRDQQLSHHVYGIESASVPQTDTRKLSNTYETYRDQH